MVQTSYPGVYIQEISSGVKTIVGVSTSIAAFFGRSSRGPVNQAVRCLSYSDFERNFGKAHPLSELTSSVRQFFENGGSDCYVVRLAHDAHRARAVLKNATHNVLIAEARMEGEWANGVRLEVDYNTPNPGATFNLRVIQEEGGKAVGQETFANLSMDVASSRYAPSFVTQSSAFIKMSLDTSAAGLGNPTDNTSTYATGSFDGYSEARRPVGTNVHGVLAVLQPLIGATPMALARTSFDISVNDSPWVTVNLQTMSMVEGDYADLSALEHVIADRVNAAMSTLVPAQTVTAQIRSASGTGFLRLTASSGARATVKLRRAASNDIAAALMMGSDNGGIEMARYSNYRPVPTGSVFRIDTGLGLLTGLDAIAALHADDITSIIVDTAATSLALDTSKPPVNPVWMTDNLPGESPNGNNDGVREKLRLIAASITNDVRSRFKAEVHGGYYLRLSPKDGPFNQLATVPFSGPGAATFNGTRVDNVRQYTLGTTGTSIFVNNAGAADGTEGSAPEFGDYLGSGTEQSGFHALDTVDLFNLMVLPTDHELTDTQRAQLWGPASNYCQSRRAFLLIDAPDTWTSIDAKTGKSLAAVVQNSTMVNDLRATVIKDYSAVFYPKILINDGGVKRTVGPTGAIAGLMARIDSSRGVWKAPAGTEADLRNLLGVEVKLTDMENGVLNKLGANSIRSFPAGFVSWGARTLDGSDDLSSEYKYIPIRRLALFLEESLFRGTQWVVFEPNDEPLWAKIRLNIGVFMNGLFRQGAFQGSTPAEAYFVKCDKDTTTQADRNLGIVNIIVGFAPLKPAEFVVITIQQIAGDLK